MDVKDINNLEDSLKNPWDDLEEKSRSISSYFYIAEIVPITQLNINNGRGNINVSENSCHTSGQDINEISNIVNLTNVSEIPTMMSFQTVDINLTNINVGNAEGGVINVQHADNINLGINNPTIASSGNDVGSTDYYIKVEPFEFKPKDIGAKKMLRSDDDFVGTESYKEFNEKIFNNPANKTFFIKFDGRWYSTSHRRMLGFILLIIDYINKYTTNIQKISLAIENHNKSYIHSMDRLFEILTTVKLDFNIDFKEKYQNKCTYIKRIKNKNDQDNIKLIFRIIYGEETTTKTKLIPVFTNGENCMKIKKNWLLFYYVILTNIIFYLYIDNNIQHETVTKISKILFDKISCYKDLAEVSFDNQKAITLKIFENTNLKRSVSKEQQRRIDSQTEKYQARNDIVELVLKYGLIKVSSRYIRNCVNEYAEYTVENLRVVSKRSTKYMTAVTSNTSSSIITPTSGSIMGINQNVIGTTINSNVNPSIPNGATPNESPSQQQSQHINLTHMPMGDQLSVVYANINEINAVTGPIVNTESSQNIAVINNNLNINGELNSNTVTNAFQLGSQLTTQLQNDKRNSRRNQRKLVNESIPEINIDIFKDCLKNINDDGSKTTIRENNNNNDNNKKNMANISLGNTNNANINISRTPTAIVDSIYNANKKPNEAINNNNNNSKDTSPTIGMDNNFYSRSLISAVTEDVNKNPENPVYRSHF